MNTNEKKCKDCIHHNVCKFQKSYEEFFNKYYENAKNENSNIFSMDLNCKYYQSLYNRDNITIKPYTYQEKEIEIPNYRNNPITCTNVAI